MHLMLATLRAPVPHGFRRPRGNLMGLSDAIRPMSSDDQWVSASPCAPSNAAECPEMPLARQPSSVRVPKGVVVRLCDVSRAAPGRWSRRRSGAPHRR